MTTDLVTTSFRIVAAGAQHYLEAHNMRAHPDVLAQCCKSWLKIKLSEALADAKEAIDCHMHQVAEATFRATLIQAGIEAAKEAGLPAEQFAHVNAISQA